MTFLHLTYIPLAGSTVLFSGGTWLMKFYADTGDLRYLAASFFVLACANLVFLPLLADGFASGVMMSAMASQILAIVIGTVYYSEPLTIQKAAAFFCASAAIWLVSTSPSTNG